jgi:hypothetical protein
MGNIDHLTEMFGGGCNDSTWNLLVPYFCGGCKGEDDKCEGCPVGNIVGQIEEQLAGLAIKYVKTLIKEWAKNSVSVC